MDSKIFFVTLNNDVKKVNIDGSNDPFYRYKMTQLHIKYLGKNKMIKTFIINIDNTSKDIKIPSEYIIAYLGYKLNTKYGFDKTQNMFYLSGRKTIEELSIIFELMIDCLVLCKQCNLPELILKIECNKLWGLCNSCGYKYGLQNDEKFVNFVKKKNNKK